MNTTMVTKGLLAEKRNLHQTLRDLGLLYLILLNGPFLETISGREFYAVLLRLDSRLSSN